MIEIQRIKLEGFKSIRAMDLELRDLNILIGPNGSGKSNFLSFFSLLREMFAKGISTHVRKSGGANALVHFGLKHTQMIRIEIAFRCGTYGFGLLGTDDDGLVVADEASDVPDPEHRFKEGVQSGFSYEARFPGYRNSQREGSAAYELIQRSATWWLYHFHDTSPYAKARLTCETGHDAFLKSDGANLASFLHFLRRTRREHYGSIVDAVRQVTPCFRDFWLEPEPANPRTIRLKWRDTGAEPDEIFGPQALSDGTLRFAMLATLLLQPEPPSLILLDEPELGLHPAAISLLAGMLRSAATRTQIVACTQSVTLVNQFGPADIVVVETQDNGSIFRRLASDEMAAWLDEYGMGDVWEKNLIGGRP